MDGKNMKRSLVMNLSERKGWPKAPQSLFDHFRNIPHRLHNYLQSGLEHLVQNEQLFDIAKPVKLGDNKSSKTWQADLERQLQAWRENSCWVDQPPEIKVSVPKGSLCDLHVKFNVGLPPDAVFNIVIDPDNKRVFKNIKEVISRKVLFDEDQRQVVEVEQAAIWRFLWWSGTISVHVLVDQNRKEHTVKFKQGKSGFMKKFEGIWKVEPLFVDEKLCSPHRPNSWAEYETCSGGKGRVGSIVSLNQLIQPALLPPPPISWYLRGITTRTTEMLIQDLLAETLRLRGAAMVAAPCRKLEEVSDEGGFQTNGSIDIKERWRSSRSKRRQSSCRA